MPYSRAASFQFRLKRASLPANPAAPQYSQRRKERRGHSREENALRRPANREQNASDRRSHDRTHSADSQRPPDAGGPHRSRIKIRGQRVQTRLRSLDGDAKNKRDRHHGSKRACQEGHGPDEESGKDEFDKKSRVRAAGIHYSPFSNAAHDSSKAENRNRNDSG